MGRQRRQYLPLPPGRRGISSPARRGVCLKTRLRLSRGRGPLQTAAPWSGSAGLPARRRGEGCGAPPPAAPARPHIVKWLPRCPGLRRVRETGCSPTACRHRISCLLHASVGAWARPDTGPLTTRCGLRRITVTVYAISHSTCGCRAGSGFIGGLASLGRVVRLSSKLSPQSANPIRSHIISKMAITGLVRAGLTSSWLPAPRALRSWPPPRRG
jgi:hypothetical protein